MKNFSAAFVVAICILPIFSARGEEVTVYTDTNYLCGDLTRPTICQFKVDRSEVDSLPLVNLQEHFEVLPAEEALNLVLENLKQTSGRIQEYKVVERRSATYRQQLDPGKNLGLPIYFFEIYSYHEPSETFLKRNPGSHQLIIERNSYVVLPTRKVIRGFYKEASAKIAGNIR